MNDDYRIGQGFDVHRFKRGRKLILGGVEIPHSFGLAGHSDADVLLHALMNAILGAIGEGDIGIHFPDTDSSTKGISSVKLLKEVLRIKDQKDYRIVNADVTLVAQSPRIAPFYSKIAENVAALLKIPRNRFNLKATTTEGLGWVGEGRGMAATAVVLLRKKIGRGRGRLTK